MEEHQGETSICPNYVQRGEEAGNGTRRATGQRDCKEISVSDTCGTSVEVLGMWLISAQAGNVSPNVVERAAEVRDLRIRLVVYICRGRERQGPYCCRGDNRKHDF